MTRRDSPAFPDPDLAAGCPVEDCPRAWLARVRDDAPRCGYVANGLPCRHPAYREEWRACYEAALGFAALMLALSRLPASACAYTQTGRQAYYAGR